MDGTDVGRETVKWYAEQILKLDGQLATVESILHRKCREIPYAENIPAINGAGANILSGILAEMGNVSRFDDVKEIQKLSGMGRFIIMFEREKNSLYKAKKEDAL